MKLDWARKYAVSVEPIAVPYDWVCVKRMLQEHAAEVTQRLERGSIIDLNPELRRELKDPSGSYARDGATVLLARLDGLCTGMVVLKRLDGDTAELGRLYSRPAGNEAGAERLLVEAALGTAYDRGIRRIVLDRATSAAPAIASLAEGWTAAPAVVGEDDSKRQLILDRTLTPVTNGWSRPRWVPARQFA